MKNLKEINIAFENCEIYKVSAENIEDIHISGIETSIDRIAANCIAETKTAHNTIIKLSKGANKPCIPFGNRDVTLFERLESNNSVTAVELIFEEDGKLYSEDISTVWEDGIDPGNNLYQKINTSDNTLTLIVSDTTKF